MANALCSIPRNKVHWLPSPCPLTQTSFSNNIQVTQHAMDDQTKTSFKQRRGTITKTHIKWITVNSLRESA